MSYLKQEFMNHLHNNNYANPGVYCNALDNVEKFFGVSIDEEYDKDQCEALYNIIQETRKNPEQIGKNEHDVRTYASRLKKYVEFRQKQDKGNNNFTWIPFYEEFADKLLPYKVDRIALILLIKKVYSDLGMKLPKLDYDEPVDIDPFTVFGLFNKGITDANRIKIIKGFKKLLNISADVPTDFSGIPVVNNLSATFYYFVGDREEHDIDNLWELFESALQYSATNSEEDKENVITAYDKVIKQHGASWNITMGLYWIRPNCYMSLDSRSRDYLPEFNPPVGASFCPKILPNGDNYFRIISELKKTFDHEHTMAKNFYELSYNAFMYADKKGKVKNEPTEDWWPSLEEYNPNITTDEWIEFLTEDSKTYPLTLKMLVTMLELGGQATCKKLAEVLGGHPSTYISRTTGLGERVKKQFNLTPCIDEGKERFFPIPFVGRRVDGTSLYAWKLRPELRKALELMDLPSDKIGVFDSWEIVGENTAIKNCDKSFFEYKSSGVPKGICWFFDAEDLSAGESRNFIISYNGQEFTAKVTNDITDRRRINISWYQDLATEIINYKDTEGCKAIFNKTDVDYFELEMRYADQTETELEMYTKAEFLNDVYIDEDKYDTCVSRLKHKKNLILQGAPGVGKTFAARRLAWSMMGVKDDSRIEFVQFHQSYSYEDFIMGYKPVENGFSLENGIFYDFCIKAKNDSENDYFFIIDEINRGNMSKIFGELLMLIESDYRNNSIKLAYSKKPFSIPENLYIIGMMNTADRSLAMIDYALRRRFSFIEMTPGFDSEGFKKYQSDINSTAFNNLIGRIKALNSDIENDASLGKGFCIGHSYFCNLDGNCENSVLKEIVEYDIVPMLEEYWFDDKAKADRWSDDLRGVLNG